MLCDLSFNQKSKAFKIIFLQFDFKTYLRQEDLFLGQQNINLRIHRTPLVALVRSSQHLRWQAVNKLDALPDNFLASCGGLALVHEIVDILEDLVGDLVVLVGLAGHRNRLQDHVDVLDDLRDGLFLAAEVAFAAEDAFALVILDGFLQNVREVGQVQVLDGDLGRGASWNRSDQVRQLTDARLKVLVVLDVELLIDLLHGRLVDEDVTAEEDGHHRHLLLGELEIRQHLAHDVLLGFQGAFVGQAHVVRAEVAGHVADDVVGVEADDGVEFVLVVVVDDLHGVVVDGLNLGRRLNVGKLK